MTLQTYLLANMWLVYLIMAWEGVWTGIAMWKTAKRNHLIWFVVFFVVNLLAIPEIIYLAVVKDKKRSQTRSKPRAKRKPRKK